MFMAYILYRTWYPEGWLAASYHLDVPLGAFNTAVLIGSSLTMALAVHAAQEGRRNQIVTFLLLTILLGGVFLGVKVVEYADKFTHHLVPGPNFMFDGPYAQPGPDLLLGLLRDDRACTHCTWSSVSAC
jgi:cytochrome c oxidase subunit III